MENKNVRIKDIALKAKVSTGTVDRVLHNRGRVSEKVKQRILKIVEDMDYKPNLIARALGSNKIYQIAALIPDHNYDLYWLASKSGIEKAENDLKQFGVHVKEFLFNPYDVQSFINKAEEVSKANPDGILLSPIFYREVLPFFERWKENKIPFVLFITQIADFNPLSYIGQDSYRSGLLAAKLIHYGEPDPGTFLILHIDEEISNAAHLLKKEQGFRNYFMQNHLSQYHIIKAELSLAKDGSFTKKLDEIIENTPELSAIFVTTSKSFEIAKYLEQHVIKHMKIVGYDLLPANIHYLNKGTISFLINQNPKGQGYWGINLLTDHLVFKKRIPELKYLPLDIVTKENASYYVDEAGI
jgi:LacI family transcriptional regulator